MLQTPAQETRPRTIQTARAGVSGDRPRRETPQVPAEVLPGAPRLKVSARLHPRDARHGVVLMAILGPCRALEPGTHRSPRPPIRRRLLPLPADASLSFSSGSLGARQGAPARVLHAVGLSFHDVLAFGDAAEGCPSRSGA